jgi:hypothetical protein
MELTLERVRALEERVGSSRIGSSN